VTGICVYNIVLLMTTCSSKVVPAFVSEILLLYFSTTLIRRLNVAMNLESAEIVSSFPDISVEHLFHGFK